MTAKYGDLSVQLNQEEWSIILETLGDHIEEYGLQENSELVVITENIKAQLTEYNPRPC